MVDKKDLGIHTEMVTSSMGRLMKSGAVNNSKKNLNKGKTIGAFVLGDQELYDYMNKNINIEIKKAAYVNNPFIIAQNNNMVSINTALEIDLTGQVCSESLGNLQFSGSGGASDFAYGAYHSKGGKGIIALYSTTENEEFSKIQAILKPGAIVSISRNIVDYIVTEYGIARLKNRCIKDRVAALINIAHPKFRDELMFQANKLMLW
ncbi:acetyl-CoA hydrolase/transferase family protein [Peptoniphilaceae bacterium SGI.131]